MNNKTKFKKLISYYKPYKKVLFTDLFCALVNAGVVLTIPLIIRYIIGQLWGKEGFKAEGAVQTVLLLSLCMLALFLLLFACNYYITYYGHLMGSKIEGDMRRDLFEHYQKLSLSFYDNEKTGSLMSRMTTDLNNICEFMHHAPEEFAIFFLRFIGAVVILSFINWLIALGIFVMIVFIFGYMFYMMPKMNKAFITNHEKIADVNHQTEESLAGVRVVKSFANEQVEIKKFSRANQGFLESKKDSFKVMARVFPAQTSFLLGMIPITIIIAIFCKLSGMPISLEDISAFMLYVDVLIGPIFGILSVYESFQDSFAGFNRFIEILNLNPEITDSKNAVELNDVKGEISIKNLCFRHKKAKNNVFTNLNLNIKQGEYIALVGASGVGKTTLCNLILRLYEATSGEILIDGVNIKDIKIKNLRDNIGFVHQDTYLFADTIASNIKYGKLNATHEEVAEAANNAYAHAFILGLQNGYDTDIGQRGLKLSGGQKQRISIARVFLKDPKILIFDEATSSLDNESEKYVQRSLEKLAKGRTTIVIAHRLSTIKNAQRILVLTENGIVDEGTHDELIARKGDYYELYNLL